ncbi:DNA (cytosine-5-)-methyltransferase [Jiangella ureilytica]|uniref:Cytosine-specific methyltransferase n=1 Tax=Jiangella ureilytica TaxID=2530374 RepID=A0A4R4RQ54_9ACTN|nr:DNA (cytosine-5-)-methyltransferase [Jiangella ureilytica]TDC52008.1 DNA (cytosine-5-)-methyltransferase [Jiangella ureilytica]
MNKTRRPSVRLVRGPFVRLEAHPDHCTTEEELRALCLAIRRQDHPPFLAADLFCGAGGLSLGLEQAGIRVVIGADHDAEALETHRHHMAGMAIDWDLGDADVVERVARMLRDNQIDVLAGGPPCQPFSKAGRSGMRHLVRQGLREPHDRRRDLWRSFLEVIRLAEPRAVIMENVPDMALDREMFILRSMVFELESLGYSVQERVVDAWRYGVPQFRQRLILVAIRAGRGFEWPAEAPKKVTVSNAISDLPRVKGGWRPKGGAEGWADYAGPRTAFQWAMRVGVPASDEAKVFDHITRPVRDDDEEAFELLDSESRYSDLPEHLKRYRDDIFDDKYKRLSGDDVSRTITAHIAKDGYGFIHPEQNRTLTVREAARIQTFPDRFRFAGPPSAAFKQIGNAVPPRLGLAIGAAVVSALQGEQSARPSSEEVGNKLATWFRAGPVTSSPWFHSTSSWHVMLGELLLDRAPALITRSLWPLLEKYATPDELLERRAELEEILGWIGREDRADSVARLAHALGRRAQFSEEELADLVSRRVITQSLADLAQLVAGKDGEEPVVVTYGALRVATRFQRNSLGRKNQYSDGRISIAKMIGYGRDARSAQLGLLELGTDVCLPLRPKCNECPLKAQCLYADSLS